MSAELKPGAESIDRLTDEVAQIVLSEGMCLGDLARLIRRCPNAVQRITDAAVATLEEESRNETIASAVAFAMIVGWKAREALMEAEELEKQWQVASDK